MGRAELAVCSSASQAWASLRPPAFLWILTSEDLLQGSSRFSLEFALLWGFLLLGVFRTQAQLQTYCVTLGFNDLQLP